MKQLESKRAGRLHQWRTWKKLIKAQTKESCDHLHHTLCKTQCCVPKFTDSPGTRKRTGDHRSIMPTRGASPCPCFHPLHPSGHNGTGSTFSYPLHAAKCSPIFRLPSCRAFRPVPWERTVFAGGLRLLVEANCSTQLGRLYPSLRTRRGAVLAVFLDVCSVGGDG